MRQVLFEIPVLHIRIFGYGLMLFLAFLAAMNLASGKAKRNRLDPEVIYDLALWLFVGGLIGARLFYVAQYWGVRVHRLVDVIKIWEGGIVLYGSAIGAAAAFLLYRSVRPFPVRPTLDVLAPAIALGIALGRVGCFLNGCCYGDRCHLPWGVAFPGPRGAQPGSPPWADQLRRGLINESTAWSLPVHPTQIYSAVDGIVIMLLLLAYYPLRKRDGEVMALLLVTYPLTRFLIEWLRNDEGAFLAGLTISQVISVPLFLGGMVYWYWLSRQPAVRYADQEPSPEPAPAGVAAQA